jgi:hypothetical protein
MNLISFALDYASYIVHHIDYKKIERIILFGSAVRGKADEDSDIDVFIETKYNLNNDIKKITEMFYDSAKYKTYWKPLGMTNTFHTICGKKEDYPDLSRTFISNGMILFGPYKGEIKGKPYALFTLEFKGKFKDKVRIWRSLYGSTQKRSRKTYTTKGIIEEVNGKRIGKGVFVVELSKSNEIIAALRKLKVKYRVYELSSDTL